VSSQGDESHSGDLEDPAVMNERLAIEIGLGAAAFLAAA
jgi:hypothetical protein